MKHFIPIFALVALIGFSSPVLSQSQAHENKAQHADYQKDYRKHEKKIKRDKPVTYQQNRYKNQRHNRLTNRSYNRNYRADLGRYNGYYNRDYVPNRTTSPYRYYGERYVYYDGQYLDKCSFRDQQLAQRLGFVLNDAPTTTSLVATAVIEDLIEGRIPHTTTNRNYCY